MLILTRVLFFILHYYAHSLDNNYSFDNNNLFFIKSKTKKFIYLCSLNMSEEKEKFGFFKSLRKQLLSDKEESPENKGIEDEENVLREITITTVKPTEKITETPLYKNISNSEYLDVKFAENFVNSNGKFIYCENKKEFFIFLNSLKKEKKWDYFFSWNLKLMEFFNDKFQTDDIGFKINEADAAISYCFSLAANEGVIVLNPEQSTNRKMLNFPKTQIIIAYKNQLKETVVEAIENFENYFPERLPSLLELHKGNPVSKENRKILLNADGPSDVYLFYIDTDKIG